MHIALKMEKLGEKRQKSVFTERFDNNMKQISAPLTFL